jgi:phosphoribosyl 1,2-cyclic phosphodiesterase
MAAGDGRGLMFRIAFWGVRGSIPTPGPTTVEVGGNTSCVEVRCGPELIILDGGTGLRGLGDRLLAEGQIRARLFFSHVHWDHIQGFPFFGPAFVPGNVIDLYGATNVTGTLEETLAGQMNFPNFPVRLEHMGAAMTFHDIAGGETITLAGGDVLVHTAQLSHPQGVLAYRIEHRGHVAVYATDTEHRDHVDERLVRLARNADLLIYDAQYTPEEYSGEAGHGSKVGWGHSTMVEGVRVAKAAGARRLILFHHDPSQDDGAVRDKERRAQELFASTCAAREGMTIDLA